MRHGWAPEWRERLPNRLEELARAWQPDTMQPPDGDAFHLSGEFLEIDPPRRLTYTFRWEEPDPDDRETVVRLRLDDAGAGTEVTLSQGEFATEARLALHRSGWTDSFEKLREIVEPTA